jgi:ATP-dependent DNA helicase RecQ
MEESQLLAAGGWVQSAVRRCQNAFVDAESTADRLALLRSLCRLRGGRIDLDQENLQLSGDEVASLPRFGLALSGRAVRIVDELESRAPTGFWQAVSLDTVPRRIQSDATADAVLIRRTSYTSYSSSAQKAGMRAVLTAPPGAALMVSMPTGSGKSLLFQLDALRSRTLDPGSCTVVITPTIALALDHAGQVVGKAWMVLVALPFSFRIPKKRENLCHPPGGVRCSRAWNNAPLNSRNGSQPCGSRQQTFRIAPVTGSSG